MLPQWIIEKKRDGQALTDGEIRSFVEAYADGAIPDYQMSALAMAIYFRGMSFAETVSLTDAMMRSGRQLDLSGTGLPTADKHSTGGIGDKVSLLLAPLAACCGVAVPMISGRGLGITGGTLDKLASIPGYRTDLSVDEFVGVLRANGCSIIGQTADLAPADRKLYALRDVTGTVPSIPLITASIMSKKLAEGAGSLVLDVKWGSGAFMKSPDRASELARSLVEVGAGMGRNMAAMITDMNQPLGRTAGNAVEVSETVAALQGKGPPDLVDLTIELGAAMLLLAGAETGMESAVRRLRDALDSGRAHERFVEMVRLHGGDPKCVADPVALGVSRFSRPVLAGRSGYVRKMDAGCVGRACLLLGAGRAVVSDDVDPHAGVSGMVKEGEQVEKGQPLLVMHSSREGRFDEARAALDQGLEVGDGAPQKRQLIAGRIVGSKKGRTQ
jgi:pyrimidine-nucleoside phosphorylase